jgi:hypothetical protein
VTDVQAAAVEPRQPGLAARLIGVIFSPRDTYAAIAARPRAAGAFAVTILLGCVVQFVFLSTEVGQNAMFDQQIAGMERFGFEVSDQMVRNLEQGLPRQRYFAVASQAVAGPVFAAIVAALLLAVCNALFDGTATFRQVYALLGHAGVIVVLQQLFSTPINYARAEMGTPASLAVFAPMLDPDGFAGGLLGAVDLFFIWWAVSVAIGLGVLYRRRTGPIATSLLGVYAIIALVIALF